MKPKSHEMQLLKTLVRREELKTPLQLNTVLFCRGKKKEKKQIRFSTLIKEDFQIKTPKITTPLNKADSKFCEQQFSEKRRLQKSINGHNRRGRKYLVHPK